MPAAPHLLSAPEWLLARKDCSFAFRTAAERFRLIPDGQVPVLVPYPKGADWAASLMSEKLTREKWRELQRFSVGVYRHTLAELLKAQQVREVAPGLFVLDARLYCESVGLDIRRSGVPAPEEMIVSS